MPSLRGTFSSECRECVSLWSSFGKNRNRECRFGFSFKQCPIVLIFEKNNNRELKWETLDKIEVLLGKHFKREDILDIIEIFSTHERDFFLKELAKVRIKELS